MQEKWLYKEGHPPKKRGWTFFKKKEYKGVSKEIPYKGISSQLINIRSIPELAWGSFFIESLVHLLLFLT